MCNKNYQGFIESVSELLKVRSDAAKLKVGSLGDIFMASSMRCSNTAYSSRCEPHHSGHWPASMCMYIHVIVFPRERYFCVLCSWCRVLLNCIIHGKCSTTFYLLLKLWDSVFLVRPSPSLSLPQFTASVASSSTPLLQTQWTDGEEAVLLCSQDSGTTGAYLLASSERVTGQCLPRKLVGVACSFRYTFSDLLNQEIPKLRQSIQDQSSAELTVSLSYCRQP